MSILYGTNGIRRAVAAALVLMAVATGVAAQDGADGSQADESALIRAAQREFVYYNSQISLLEQRLAEVREEGEARVQSARSELTALERQLLQLTSQVDRRLDELQVVEQEELDVQDRGDSLQNIISQGTARLRDSEIPSFVESGLLPADSNLGSGDRVTLELGYIFDQSFGLLQELGTIRTTSEPFFLATGEEVQGEITFVGQIAAFGAAADAAGTLAPAGGGRLRLVDPETAQVARRLTGDPSEVATFPLFLYESLDELVETERGTTLAETIEGGGIIGIIILAIGGVSVILILIRIAMLLFVGRTDEKGINQVYHAVQSKNMQAAQEAADKQPGAMGRVLASTVRGLRIDPENIEDVISESVLNEQPTIDRFRSALSVFAAVAPLLGLLGTVTGMISTFEVITQFGTGDPRLLSGGISEALITTEFGLIVAIPVLLIGNLLSSWADRITSNMEVAALRVVNIAGGYESEPAAAAAQQSQVAPEPAMAGGGSADG